MLTSDEDFETFAAGARWIVSGDEHLLGLEEPEGIRIVGAATAISVLGKG